MAGRILRVALTGGIATGKSHCLRQFAALGAPVLDADVLAHDALSRGSAGLAAVRARFGADLVTATGDLDRRALARIVFADASARRDLEAIVHPLVFAGIRAWYASLPTPASGVLPAIADVPLLYETGHERDFDVVVVAACPPDQQVARIVTRDRLSVEDARLRLASQMPVAEKALRADLVIDTSTPVEETDRQVATTWRSLQARL